MIEIVAKPFDWNDKIADVAIEDFNAMIECATYGSVATIGTALAKLKLLEEQGCKVEEVDE